MKKIFFTPGPTELYPEVINYIAQAYNENVCSISHRSPEFMNIYKYTVEGLKKVLDIPDDYSIFFLSSATECMDRIIQNCVREKSFHFVNGAFAERFYKTALELDKNPYEITVPYGEGFNFDSLTIENDYEIYCVTQNETSTGVAVAPEEIYKLKALSPDSLIAVDIVTSAPFIFLDYNKIDCAFFSVQKGFGLPSGLGVLILNQKCINKARSLKENNINIGSYHNFISLHDNAIKYQTTETPNVLGIYLLGKVCENLNQYGIGRIRNETEEKANMLYEFFDRHKIFKPFVKNKSDRSKTIITIDVGDKQKDVKKDLAAKGIIVGSGYGNFKNTQIRIANFPMHKREDIERILSELDR